MKKYLINEKQLDHLKSAHSRIEDFAGKMLSPDIADLKYLIEDIEAQEFDVLKETDVLSAAPECLSKRLLVSTYVPVARYRDEFSC